ncbi:hypothetical protein R5H28_13975 [Acinetobacter baumannii]|uniref:hypothetical protein n=1 Tax=Acinetobacter baumannii TaxID=470 RepID=UPI002965D2CC|nr:hypothetical protein [Acinetobacter baumannii]MDW3027596.1 hypothetical protein [Acinetobacter baumannii]
MIDLAKQRAALMAEVAEFKKDCMELWFVPDLADSYKNSSLFEFSILDEEVFFLKEQARQLWTFWNKAKAQAVPTWISVEDEEPPTDIMVLICWADAPDVTPEQDYMTIDDDLNSVWANYQNDTPSHWMHFHSVPNVSGAANE